MKLIFPKTLISIPLLLAAAGFCAKTLAQTADDDAKVVYPAAYFVEWSPVTAQDMLNRIPGMSGGGGGGGPGGGGGGGGRGLGGGGGDQILIDGKRVAGKNNQTGSQLSRIAASKVSHIEIIRSSSAALDVRGSQVVNIVLLEALSTSTVSYEVNADRYQDGHVQPGGKLAYTGQTGDFSYVLSGEAEPRHDYNISRENSRLGDWSPNDRIRENRTRDQTSYTYTANLGYVLNEASSVRFNALYSQNDNDTVSDRFITNLRVTPNTIRVERDDVPTEQANWEIGGDYQYNFASGNRFRILFISNENDRSNIRERYLVLDDTNRQKNLYLKSASTTTERIVRSSYTRGLRAGQDLELGVERAQTTLDSSLLMGLPLSSGIPSPAFGGLVPVTVNNANSTVEEIRYEPFVVHNWQISPRMTLESSLIYELSEITQQGDVSKQRDFSFLKPSVDWRFNVTPEFQLKAMVHKMVRQLSFSDFVASSNNRDLDSNTEAGNENLRQEQVWRAAFSAEYRLPNDQGVIDGSVSYMKHFDVIERMDVSTSPTVLQSANGNIGDGIMYDMNLNAAIRMNMINLPNLLVTANLNVQDSEIKDPFLGIDRRFENYNRGRFNLGFRHDIPSLKMNYGVNWSNRFDGGMKRYDIDNIETMSGKPFVNAFLQFVAFQDITFRFDARNATNGANCRRRERFQGPITSGIITETEFNCFSSGRVVSLKISGNF
jgi:outer membrane receptor for ferrienterochelin and colicins